MIKLVCFDIDGVLTDGCIYVDCAGNEIKKIGLCEIDALNDIKKAGYKIAALTGENTPITEYFRNKIEWDSFECGCKNKKDRIIELQKNYGINQSEICYIGDGKYDIEAISYAGLGVCPDNAIEEVKGVSDIVLKGRGGESCINELCHVLKSKKV